MLATKVSTKSQSQFDIRQLLEALGVNMTVNKLKEGEQPVIEAEELASRRLMSFIRKCLRTVTQALCLPSKTKWGLSFLPHEGQGMIFYFHFDVKKW